MESDEGRLLLGGFAEENLPRPAPFTRSNSGKVSSTPRHTRRGFASALRRRYAEESPVNLHVHWEPLLSLGPRIFALVKQDQALDEQLICWVRVIVVFSRKFSFIICVLRRCRSALSRTRGQCCERRGPHLLSRHCQLWRIPSHSLILSHALCCALTFVSCAHTTPRASAHLFPRRARSRPGRHRSRARAVLGKQSHAVQFVDPLLEFLDALRGVVRHREGGRVRRQFAESAPHTLAGTPQRTPRRRRRDLWIRGTLPACPHSRSAPPPRRRRRHAGSRGLPRGDRTRRSIRFFFRWCSPRAVSPGEGKSF